MSRRQSNKQRIPALKVKQWLAGWDHIKWKPKEKRTEPQHWFYQFSISAADLKALSGIYPRTTQRRRASQDLGIQRRHEEARSAEIHRFVQYGYPWSDLSEAKRKSDEYNDLRQPGWLPTAIVVNILTSNDERSGKKVAKGDLVTIDDHPDGSAIVKLPDNYSGSKWQYQTRPPIEIIDGQHRLWAFKGASLKGDFELPVVAFVGLDLSWQAYLFYTINIKPKKINPSLAFDLYPLLRDVNWLTKFEGHIIYRETRAQEIVDLLWSHPESPWYHRINMLGEKGSKGLMVTQAAWIRTLLATFIKSWEGRRVQIGGLFGTSFGQHDTVLPWSRADQTAFLIVAGEYLQNAIKDTKVDWAKALRKDKIPSLFEEENSDIDLAFSGPNTLLNHDQGIRTLLSVLNDIFFILVDKLSLHQWGDNDVEEDANDRQISASIQSLKKKTKIINTLKELAIALARYDWRASSAPNLTNEERLLKAAFRGSGGYKEFRKDVLTHLSKEKGTVASAAKQVKAILRY